MVETKNCNFTDLAVSDSKHDNLLIYPILTIFFDILTITSLFWVKWGRGIPQARFTRVYLHLTGSVAVSRLICIHCKTYNAALNVRSNFSVFVCSDC